MEDYNPQDASTLEGTKFMTHSGSVYEIKNSVVRNARLVIEEQRGIIYIGSPPENMTTAEITRRAMYTNCGAQSKIEKLAAGEKRDLRRSDNSGIVEVLVYPKIGLSLIIGLITEKNSKLTASQIVTSRIAAIIAPEN